MAQTKEQGGAPQPSAEAAPEASTPAERALAEAAQRRAAARTAETGRRDTEAKEVGGRDGPDPTRYGDWEKKGIISDF